MNAARLKRLLANAAGTRFLLIACTALLLLALADPSVPREQRRYNYVMLIDITQSMNTVDARIGNTTASRLEAAKRSIHTALAALPCGSRVGLALFSEYRVFLLFTPVEVCAAYTELTTALERIDNRMSWAGASEIAKGLNFALQMLRSLGGDTAIAFFTDGHEAPPLNSRHRPRIESGDGNLHGIIVGVGGDALQPIPKFDPDGKPLGLWRADEVLQTDPRSLGRGSSIRGEKFADEPFDGIPSAVYDTPGNEHRSSLREAYLKQLARETGLHYARLSDARGLVSALSRATQGAAVRARVSVSGLPAAAALALLVGYFTIAFLRAQRGRPTTA